MRLSAALVLLVAGISKIFSLDDGLNRWVLWVALLAICEIGFAIVLVSNGWPRFTWWSAMGCFAMFGGYSGASAWEGLESCGCFGEVPVNPIVSLGIDVLVVCLLLTVVQDGIGITLRLSPTLALATFVSISISAGVLIKLSFDLASNQRVSLGVLTHSVDGGRVALEPEQWVDQKFPLIQYLDQSERLTKGKWVLLLTNSGCDACHRREIEFIDSFGDVAESENVPDIAIVETSRTAMDSSLIHNVVRYHLVIDGLKVTHQPYVLLLDEGVVSSTFDSNYDLELLRRIWIRN